MPLDEFQKSVLRVLGPLRSPRSVFAGGSVLHLHGFRLSDDQDIFHAEGEDIRAIATRDTAALQQDGFLVDLHSVHDGLMEALVVRDEVGRTKVQWVAAGAWNFFQPVPDPEMGWRLHMADLSINKTLAAGGRRQVRDYVDLTLIHRHIMPLWHALWAAPGKDESWSPASLAKEIAKTNGFRQEAVEEVVSMMDLSAAEIGGTVRAALAEAREVFDRLPADRAGMLFVDGAGNLVNDVEAIASRAAGITAIEPRRGGTWPSGQDIDGYLIRNVVKEFGWEGSGPGGAPVLPGL